MMKLMWATADISNMRCSEPVWFWDSLHYSLRRCFFPTGHASPSHTFHLSPSCGMSYWVTEQKQNLVSSFSGETLGANWQCYPGVDLSAGQIHFWEIKSEFFCVFSIVKWLISSVFSFHYLPDYNKYPSWEFWLTLGSLDVLHCFIIFLFLCVEFPFFHICSSSLKHSFDATNYWLWGRKVLLQFFFPDFWVMEIENLRNWEPGDLLLNLSSRTCHIAITLGKLLNLSIPQSPYL